VVWTRTPMHLKVWTPVTWHDANVMSLQKVCPRLTGGIMHSSYGAPTHPTWHGTGTLMFIKWYSAVGRRRRPVRQSPRGSGSARCGPEHCLDNPVGLRVEPSAKRIAPTLHGTPSQAVASCRARWPWQDPSPSDNSSCKSMPSDRYNLWCR
jgi:hypothetical protein